MTFSHVERYLKGGTAGFGAAGTGGLAILKSGGTLNIAGSSLAPGLIFFISVTLVAPVLGSVTED